MKFRFVSWNINYRRLTARHLELIRDLRADVLALQEVSAAFHGELERTNLFAWSKFSLALRPTQEGEGRSRRLGCSLFGAQTFTLLEAALVPNVVILADSA